tara:strand:- start:231 stop:479 length:249 start_codon:yes stop_codon:yes gene_type:complete
MSKKNLKLTKVPILELMHVLNKLFEEGADFIDIDGEDLNTDQDKIKVTVRPEYYSNEELDAKFLKDQKLTSEDIDKLSNEFL